jgi:hypothetical protein
MTIYKAEKHRLLNMSVYVLSVLLLLWLVFVDGCSFLVQNDYHKALLEDGKI